MKDALVHEAEDHIKAAAIWSLGQLGRHTPDHAKALAQADIFRPMVRSSRGRDASAQCAHGIRGHRSKCSRIPRAPPT